MRAAIAFKTKYFINEFVNFNKIKEQVIINKLINSIVIVNKIMSFMFVIIIIMVEIIILLVIKSFVIIAKFVNIDEVIIIFNVYLFAF